MAYNKKLGAPDSGQQPSRPKTTWTVMIYLAGDNNLTANCISVMQELEAANPNKHIQVLACFDSNTPRPQGSRYLEVNRRLGHQTNMDWAIHEDLVPPDERGHAIIAPNFCEEDKKVRTQANTAVLAAEGLSRFISWATENHPAERYMLITYGHGGAVAGQTFLAKENPASFLTLQEFHKVLAKYFGGKTDRPKLEILACDNCIMNGLETAYEIRDQVSYMIGSQGLMLAVGWPYRDIVNALARDPNQPASTFAGEILAACARNLLDFTLMDRSSEQSVCDLTKFGSQCNIMGAVKKLADILIASLQFASKQTPPNQGQQALVYPCISDAIRLARLEAQAFWGETFVDLYDFCERLMWKCGELVLTNAAVLQDLGSGDKSDYSPEQVRTTPLILNLKNIAEACNAIMAEVQGMVPESFYIGADLQYSHGLSVYFPWTRQEKPYTFKRANGQTAGRLQTAFETYQHYEFAVDSHWSKFLESFYRATLRKVRRADRKFVVHDETASIDLGLVDFKLADSSNAVAINLQKTSSDMGIESDCSCSPIKNYPRRNYLSPADCARRTDQAGRMRRELNQEPVSYLGWNLRGLVAEVIAPQVKKDIGKRSWGIKRR
jgi:hypothetical protein